jgi:uncharacterized protein YcbK (DUF882 family)
MGDLSKNFATSEFRCHCGCERMQADPRLLAGLEKLRSFIQRPITINSGFRCPAHNATVGGAANSQHVLGRAADITAENYTPSELFVVAEHVLEFRNGGIGIYPLDGFLHVDVRQGRARWGLDKLLKTKEV